MKKEEEKLLTKLKRKKKEKKGEIKGERILRGDQYSKRVRWFPTNPPPKYCFST